MGKHIDLTTISPAIILKGEKIKVSISILAKRMIKQLSIRVIVPKRFVIAQEDTSNRYEITDGHLIFSHEQNQNLSLLLPNSSVQVYFWIKVPKNIIPANLSEILDDVLKFIDNVYKIKVSALISNNTLITENTTFHQQIGLPIPMPLKYPILDLDNESIYVFTRNIGNINCKNIKLNYNLKINVKKEILTILNSRITFVDPNKNEYYIEYKNPVQINFSEFMNLKDERHRSHVIPLIEEGEMHFEGEIEDISTLTPITCKIIN